MRYNNDQKLEKTARVRKLFAAALVLGCALGTASQAAAEDITPEQGNHAFLSTRGVGTQGYTCLPTSPGATTASWTVKGARPEATLFQSFFGQDFQVITHFLSPDTNPNQNAPKPLPFGSVTWQSSFDSSKVWAQKVKSTPADSTNPICPNAGAIDCLLLQSIGSLQGPTGGNTLTKVTFIQRINTSGGSAPDDTDGCGSIANVGNQRLVPYSATYVFFRGNE